MTISPLSNRRILVVEDEYFLADELQTELESAGAIVVGPVGGLSQALAVIAASADIDGAILDVNLRGETVFPAAEILLERNIPLLFVSGYDPAVIPPWLGDQLRCQKPIAAGQVIETLVKTLQHS